MRKDFVYCIEEAKKCERIITFSFKGVLNLINENLLDSETVKYVMGCNLGRHANNESLNIQPFNLKNAKPGILIITTKRILHCFRVLFLNEIEQIMLKDINNIESKGNFWGSIIRVQSTTNIMDINIRSNLVTEVTKLLHELRDNSKDVISHNINNFSYAKESIERIILRKAKETKGILTASEVVLAANISIDEAKKHLDAMVSKGFAELRVRKSGSLVYTIPDILDMNEPLEDF